MSVVSLSLFRLASVVAWMIMALRRLFDVVALTLSFSVAWFSSSGIDWAWIEPGHCEYPNLFSVVHVYNVPERRLSRTKRDRIGVSIRRRDVELVFAVNWRVPTNTRFIDADMLVHEAYGSFVYNAPQLELKFVWLTLLRTMKPGTWPLFLYPRMV